MLFSNSNTCYGIYTGSPELSCTGNTKQESVSHTKYFSTSAPKIEAVPPHLSLAPDRYYLWLTIDFERWGIPIQLTRSEASRLLPEVAEVRDRESALRIVERVLPPMMESAE